MDYVTLGRTGLKVSVAGLGCGGFSRLGLGTGKSEADAIALVRQAFDLGVNIFDTAAAYGTEAVLGRALRTVPRDRVVICTKAPFGASNPNSPPRAPSRASTATPKELGTDYIDVYYGIAPAAYDHALNELAPALLREKEKGKFRHLGISETAPHDPEHRMVTRACRNGVWEVAMVGFHMMHQNARQNVFPLTRQYRVGTLLMFAVRNIFSQPGRLQRTMREWRPPGWCRRRSPTVPIRSAFWSTRAAPAASSTPPTALCATSRASMWCGSVLATTSTSRPISARC